VENYSEAGGVSQAVRAFTLTLREVKATWGFDRLRKSLP
jgi:hypothetical protein